MKTSSLFAVVLLLTLSHIILAQAETPEANPCDLPEVKQFDFWLGDWEQTWVDTEGSYLLFTGQFKDGIMELRSPERARADGTTVASRMIFKNIRPDSFDWDYQVTKDQGKTWKDDWNIHYQRKK